MKYRRLKLALTEACNLDCTHCYMGEKKKDARWMSTEDVFRFLKEAHDLGVEVIDLTGGEPTLHPDFLAIVKFVLDLGFSKLNVSTNGFGLSLLNLDILRNLKAHYFISMDGVSDEVVNKIRGRNVGELLGLFRELKRSNMSFSLRFSVNAQNWQEVSKMVAVAEELGVGADFEPTQFVGNASENLLLSHEQLLFVTEVLTTLPHDLHIPIEESFTKPFPCDGGQSDLLSIDTGGVGTVCLMMGVNNQIVTPGMSLKEMWDTLIPYKEGLKSFCPSLPRCATCNQYGLCLSGCRATAYTKQCLNPWMEGGS